MKKHLYYYPNHTAFLSSTDLKNIHNVIYCDNETHLHYDYYDYSKDYFTIINISSQDATITITKTANAEDSTSPLLYYSITSDSLTNERVWQSIIAANMEVGITGTVTITPGSKIVFKGTVSGNYSASAGPFSFRSNKDIKVEGNIMSLINGDNFTNSNTLSLTGIFSSLFKNNTHLIDASNLILPATTLTNYCYVAMFDGCSYLTKAPKLPATSLALSCYNGMFSETALTVAPELPATILTGACYNNMFYGCTSLTTVPLIAATTLATSCCSSMFEDCTALVKAPDLLATTLAPDCYNEMFNGCRNLNYMKCLATNISAEDCTEDWLFGVSNTGTFIKAASMNGWSTGVNGIPSGWTVQNASN